MNIKIFILCISMMPSHFIYSSQYCRSVLQLHTNLYHINLPQSSSTIHHSKFALCAGITAICATGVLFLYKTICRTRVVNTDHPISTISAPESPITPAQQDTVVPKLKDVTSLILNDAYQLIKSNNSSYENQLNEICKKSLMLKAIIAPWLTYRHALIDIDYAKIEAIQNALTWLVDATCLEKDEEKLTIAVNEQYDKLSKLLSEKHEIILKSYAGKYKLQYNYNDTLHTPLRTVAVQPEAKVSPALMWIHDRKMTDADMCSEILKLIQEIFLYALENNAASTSLESYPKMKYLHELNVVHKERLPEAACKILAEWHEKKDHIAYIASATKKSKSAHKAKVGGIQNFVEWLCEQACIYGLHKGSDLENKNALYESYRNALKTYKNIVLAEKFK